MSNQKKEKKKTPAGKVFTVLGILILLVPVLAAAMLLVPRIAGYEEYTVATGSMEPEYPVGSLILVEEKDPGTINEGEVITFRSAGDPEDIVTHRVVKNDHERGQLTTKGDANRENDFQPVRYENVVGAVTKCIPKAGFVAGMAREMTGIIILIACIGACFALLIASTYMRRKN